MNSHRVAFIGLPATGKSTYLGTLWHMVEEPSVTEVREAELASDSVHVQQLAEANREMSRIARTRHDADDGYANLVEFAGYGTVSIDLHDRSGEQLQGLVERRTWPELLLREMDEAEGLVLFVSPDTIRAPLSNKVSHAWESLLPDAELAQAGGTADERAEEQSLGESEATGPKEYGDYDTHAACTAAKLVDALENLLDAMSDRWPVSVSVVVSKFDLVSDRTPDAWLRERLPALVSMLDADVDRIRWAAFGVSALGGSHNESEEVLRLGDLHERARSVDGDNKKVSFTAPVRWALGWR